MTDARIIPFDPFVARAIAAMKKAPANKWTVASLAKLAGLSRAAFARRFRKTTGKAPMTWLLEHRLVLAQTALAASDASIAEIAFDVGYANEFALSKAFKRVVGVAPGLFRKNGRARVTQFFAAA